MEPVLDLLGPIHDFFAGVLGRVILRLLGVQRPSEETSFWVGMGITLFILVLAVYYLST